MEKYETLTEIDKICRMSKLFPIISLAREDIVSSYEGNVDEDKAEEIEKIVKDLTDREMEIIAENMYEDCFENFWETLVEAYEDYYYGTMKQGINECK